MPAPGFFELIVIGGILLMVVGIPLAIIVLVVGANKRNDSDSDND